MALIKCPECKKKISDQCGKCPNCGYPIETMPTSVTTQSETTVVIDKQIENTKKERKPINKKLLIGIVSAVVVLLTVGGILSYNTLLPRISATKDFKTAVKLVQQKNEELDTKISQSEKLILTKAPLLDESLITALENAISDAKAVKITDFKAPKKVKDIVTRTAELNQVSYTDVIKNLNDKRTALEIDTKRYQLVNIPAEAYIIQCLKTIPEITGISAVTEDNDPNGNLNKAGGYTATVYFSHKLINQKDVYGDTLIEKGTDAGGAIEVYTCVEDAVKRRDYLAVFDGTITASGTHTVVGTVLVRTSNELTASQQKELETKIIAALIFLPDVDKERVEQEEIGTTTANTTTPPNSTPSHSNITTLSRKELSIHIALSNVAEAITPNALKDILSVEGFSSNEIDYALYGGHINWQPYISDYVYSLNFETEGVTITTCHRCWKKFYGRYECCQYTSCGGSVGWTGYPGYSRAETITKLLSAGYTETDVTAAMQKYEYGEFIDEKDFSDCIFVSGTLCEHVWNPATCQILSTCPYCGETKGDYAEHTYNDHQCIYCGEEEPWTPPQINCSDWVSLKELQEKTDYYIETPHNTITIKDLNDYRVNFVLENLPNSWTVGDTFELKCNGVTIHCKTSNSDYVYNGIKLKYSDLVAAGVLS